jgi:hypothetical protein
MKKLLITAAAATMLITAVPAFAASPGDDAEWDRTPQPPPSGCHFVLERMITPTGHVILQRQQVCD